FNSNPNDPDPGRVTVRRLNRVEYRNTIKDLMGVDYNTDTEFPPDDTGHGFDNIGEVLTISPMLLEKYLSAAKIIVSQTVPNTGKVTQEMAIPGKQFVGKESRGGPSTNGAVVLSYYEPAAISNQFALAKSGQYKVAFDFTAIETYVDGISDLNKCKLTLSVDGEPVLDKEFVRENGKPFHLEYDRTLTAGNHLVGMQIAPVLPGTNKVRNLGIRLTSVTLRGPSDKQFWVKPKNYEKYFTKEVPTEKSKRKAYAREILSAFATKAYRRPVDAETADALASLAESIYSQPRTEFEAGIAQSMVAVLASPRFLFREEVSEKAPASANFVNVDEYSLASRLSYFLWSSMPDQELLKLAADGKLRKNLPAQIKRMLGSPKSDAFVQNFSGQWLQTRDVITIPIDARSVLARENAAPQNAGRGFGNRPRNIFDDNLRKAMQKETESYFGYVMRENRSILEFLESDYTFLNEQLAKHYALTNLDVTGVEMRKVNLPPDSPRGGILTQGSVLVVTSNPTRTSPVKRGLFVLDNVLGTPPPPPPPDIPPLEDAGRSVKDRVPSLRETLELHRSKAICASCHARMDPLGLALDNFNAMGMWRTNDLKQPIDASGKLITGEMFKDIRDVKHILVTQHKRDFYRTLTEKLLTYALGRGLDYYDVETIDKIVDRLDKEDGQFSALLNGVIESSAFQKRRNKVTLSTEKHSTVPQQRAELTLKP
ncbi:MAG: hypothetical protein JWM04_204, partial [Verrucomicrobiales bacterium]|nr:hypothetical protein [Verrucomicrobiales bacterium]